MNPDPVALFQYPASAFNNAAYSPPYTSNNHGATSTPSFTTGRSQALNRNGGDAGAVASTAANVMQAQSLVGEYRQEYIATLLAASSTTVAVGCLAEQSSITCGIVIQDNTHFPYSSAAYTQSIPAPAQAIVQQPQHSTPEQSSTAATQLRISPNATSQQLQQKVQTSPSKYPMAAPPLPQSPANGQQYSMGSAPPTPGTPQPQTAEGLAREQQRVALLLDINTELLQELNKLIASGASGAPNTVPNTDGSNSSVASEEYLSVLRRVQENLRYLMPVAQNDASKTPKGPGAMTSPPTMPQLQPKYDRLRELFPGWEGQYDPATRQQMFGRS
ncbi:hypothetical protein LTR62_002407 [Meristemomyces frigidus]|uniref:Uncharacterized protein n=1 Tax=Meristemomyces frigidus TaxID=1508187 RepID=A0AAN7YHI3_9PEZI|nr:hypothetical protein LTR62_002407 [Meristemomyces frigidus]